MRKQADQIRLEDTGEKKRSEYAYEIKDLLVAVVQMAVEDHLRCPEGTADRVSADRFLQSQDFEYLIWWIYDYAVDPKAVQKALFSGGLTWEKYKKQKAVKGE